MSKRQNTNRHRRFIVERFEARALMDGAPLITEFMALNDHTFADQGGEYEDWIELHNAADEPVNLDGWYLTDEARNLTRWRLPNVTLGPRGYLVVFASGKNLSDPLAPLHTSFKLSGEGEFLALVEPNGQTIRQSYAPSFPEQEPDVSYGLAADLTTTLYFAQPTPGTANGDGFIGLAGAPAASEPHGLFTSPFDLSLVSNTPDAEIRYTLDGSLPRPDSGHVYQGPIHVDRTMTLRAATYKSGYLASKVVTQTYLFPENVLTQSRPAGYPDLLAGDYGIVPAAVAAHRDTILDDLRAVPSISLITSVDDMFGPNGVYTLGEDRPASVELIYPDGRSGFQVDAALRQQGGASRLPTVPKHAFRLRFTSDYGPTKLEYPLFADSSVTEFDTIILRAGLQDGWQGGLALKNQYIKDEFARRTQLAMGHPSAHGNWVHVYINGLYWGMYNLTERPDASFTSAYLGGDKDDWDVLNAGSIRDGNTTAWDQMLALTPRGVPDLPNFNADRVAANYQAIQQYLDIPGFIDYLIIGSYMSTSDWLPNNYYAGRRGRDGDQPVDPTDEAGRFRFFHWDQEASFLDLEAFRGPPGFGTPVGRIYQLLKLSPEFRQLAGQHLYDHFYNGGALSIEASVARYQRLIDEVSHAIKGEAIRWGADASNVPDWEAEGRFLIDTLLPGRRDGILSLYRRLGLYPNVDAPVFSQQGGKIRPDEMLSMSATDAQIYYTLDGSDPRMADGSVAPGALLYGGPINLTSDVLVRARALTHDEWSAYNDAQFLIDRSAGPGDINLDGLIGAADIDLLCRQIRFASTDAAFDLNGDQHVDRGDHNYWIRDILQTRPGDTNLDRVFDSADLVAALQLGNYEHGVEAGWAAGDWNCDGFFGTSDLVLAFQAGGFGA